MVATVWTRLTAALAAVIHWRYFKPAVFVACLIPGLIVAWRLYLVLSGQDPMALDVDPKKTLLHETGQNALLLLFITLAVTPVRRIFKINRVQTVRRMLGVWSFTYAFLHLSTYLVFDQLCYSPSTCQFNAIVEDVLKRRFIFMGMLAFSCLLLLAITSTNGWQRRLKKNWARLHKLVYVAAVAGVVHFIWIQKSDIREPLQWAAWLALLFTIRIYYAWQKKQARAKTTVGAAAPARPS